MTVAFSCRQWVFDLSKVFNRSAVCFSTSASLQQQQHQQQQQPTKPFDSIPGPRSLPILKSAWAFFPYVGDYSFSTIQTSYMKMYHKYGSLVRFESPDGRKNVALFNSDLYRKVFAEEGPYPARPDLKYLLKYRKSKPHLYKNLGLFLLQGPEWKELRFLGQKPMLRVPAVRAYLSGMEKVSEDFLRVIRDIRNKDLEVDNFLQKLFPWALESLGTFVLHKRLGCLDKNLDRDSQAQRLIQAVGDTFESLYRLEFGVGLTPFFPQKAYNKLVKAQDYFTTVVRDYLQEALAALKERGPRKSGEDVFLLDTFLLDSEMDVDQVSGIVMDIFFAGIDTTSSTAAFTLYHLAKNPDKQEELHREITRLHPDAKEPLKSQELDAMGYLRACVKESLRINPIVVGTARILDHDITLEGYHIPQGTILSMISPVNCLLEENFERPLDFIPERWLHGSPAAEEARRKAGLRRPYAPTPFEMLPFGHGTRACIGRRFAEQELYILMVKLLQNFRVEYHHEPIEGLQGIINVPNRPLRLQFHDRK